MQIVNECSFKMGWFARLLNKVDMIYAIPLSMVGLLTVVGGLILWGLGKFFPQELELAGILLSFGGCFIVSLVMIVYENVELIFRIDHWIQSGSGNKSDARYEEYQKYLDSRDGKELEIWDCKLIVSAAFFSSIIWPTVVKLSVSFFGGDIKFSSFLFDWETKMSMFCVFILHLFVFIAVLGAGLSFFRRTMNTRIRNERRRSAKICGCGQEHGSKPGVIIEEW